MHGDQSAAHALGVLHAACCVHDRRGGPRRPSALHDAAWRATLGAGSKAVDDADGMPPRRRRDAMMPRPGGRAAGAAAAARRPLIDLRYHSPKTG